MIRARKHFKYFGDMADTSDVNLREAVTCQTSLFVFFGGGGGGVNRTEIVGA